MSGFSLGLAYLLDLLIGDPAGWPHPVRIIGGLIDRLARVARMHFHTPRSLRLAGVAIVVIVVGLTGVVSWLLLLGAGWLVPWLGQAVAVLLAYTTLASRSLYEETWRVALALKDDDLVRARGLLGMVVGRETHSLDRPAIYRALIETLAENLSDGIIAPLFYLALGGPILGLVYKAINTLDSMIGYKDEKNLHLGWAAARLDDVANYLPARITAALIVLASLILKLDAKSAVKTWWADGGRHTSPNAGRPEAALAGALGIQLGGPNVYHGELVVKPTIGRAINPPTERQVIKAEQAVLLAGALMLAAAMFVLEVR